MAPSIATLALPASLVADAEAAIGRLDAAGDDRPAGLADLVAAALIHVLDGRCHLSRRERAVVRAARDYWKADIHTANVIMLSDRNPEKSQAWARRSRAWGDLIRALHELDDERARLAPELPLDADDAARLREWTRERETA